MINSSPHDTYLRRLGDYLEQMYIAEHDSIRRAGELVAERVGVGGVLHTFGTGHSSLVAAEPSYRAGGLAAVNFLGILPGRAGWGAAIEGEKDASPAQHLVRRGGVREGDIVAIVSHSGRSPLVLAVTQHAIEMGAITLALTASAKNPLATQTALVLETGAPADDCAMSSPVHPYGSISSILTLMLLNAVIAGAVGILIESGSQLPVLESVHTQGGPKHNERVMAPLKSRIPCWTYMPCIET